MDTTRLALLKQGYATAAPDGDARFLLDSVDALSERVAALEAALRDALRCGWHSMEGSLDGTFDDLTQPEIAAMRRAARAALPPPPAADDRSEP